MSNMVGENRKFFMARNSRYKWSWQRQVAFLNAAVTLAAWRWRTQRFLLLIAGIGITTAIVLVGSLPMFSDMMTTAGLRSVLRAQPNSAQIIANTSMQGISSGMVAGASSQVNNL